MKEQFNKINNPKQLKKMTYEELNELARCIRDKIIKTTAMNGGHLASNLGTVELTLALHYVLNAPEDKIVWDVGHQCYTHKLLTGRWDTFETLRKHKGISGFPKREESIYDTFNTGHSSTSLSLALGLAYSRDIQNKDYKVVAVIGDGALTGGMAFEALNNAGRYNKNLIFILNDNDMSISKNVGGLSKYLSKIRTMESYIKTDKRLKKFTFKIPVLGKPIVRCVQKLKGTLKYLMMPSVLFEDIGFKYIGPIDGHNIRNMVDTFQTVFKIDRPVIIHVITQKGKGYDYAEQKPGDYHSVSPFSIEKGINFIKNTKSFSEVFADEVIRLAAKNKNLVTISAAMSKGTGLDLFEKKFPDRFFDVGIAEQHAVTFAAGLAGGGLIPVVAIYSTFLQRTYDQVLHDVALQNLHVIFAIDRAGLAEGDGETHHGIYDVSFLMHIPGITILAAADYNDLEHMLRYAVYDSKGPVAIRYPRCSGTRFASNDCKVVKGRGTVIGNQSDVCIIAVDGLIKDALYLKDTLNLKNIHAKVVNPRFLKPLDRSFYEESVMSCDIVIIMEETIAEGGFAQALIVNLFEWGYTGKIKTFSLKNNIIPAGKKDALMIEYGWTHEEVIKSIIMMITEIKNKAYEDTLSVF